MNKTVVLLLVNCIVIPAIAQWQPAGDKIKTVWASQIDVNNVLPEYPRPIMERTEWLNLNGLWDYSILKSGLSEPTTYEGKILVPFPVESSLSGVMKTVGSENEVWYHRTFEIPTDWKGKNIILHFGAVDWRTDIWLNNIKVATHTGGFTPFSYNITHYLGSATTHKLVVKVWDPTEKGYQSRGKQSSVARTNRYTPVTGIWQTVWMEPVDYKHIKNILTVPDIDAGNISINVESTGLTSCDEVELTVMEGSTVRSTSKVTFDKKTDSGKKFVIALPNAKLWSPESPFLYDIKVRIISNGVPGDEVKSYFAMRKISSKKDETGYVRLELNNKPYFHFGPLDQGWWPDGLYTAPSDAALKFDIQKTKDLGFNMIRKHVKLEPARWYTHCDRIGMLVWQDMPNSDNSPARQPFQYYTGNELVRTAESEAHFRKELKEMIDYLYSYPSIVTWVIFNEAWGQFKTPEFTQWTKNYDPSRLVIPASGGNHYKVGDMLSIHHYPDPKMPMFDEERATVLGEYGGCPRAIIGNVWNTERVWGAVQYKTSETVTNEYIAYSEQLIELIKNGCSGAVYTQTTDMENEVSGLITYDRKIIKMNAAKVREINLQISNFFSK
jgi:beta-galactosidase/beta-glucuronidase